MLERYLRLSGWMVLMCLMGAANAQPDPVNKVQYVANKVVKSLSSAGRSLRTNPRIAYRIVKRELVPHVDKWGMARSVLGRRVWNGLTTRQRNQFTKELLEMVVRTYSRPLTKFKNETVKVYPIRGGYHGKKRVRIKSLIKRAGASDIPLHYRLILIKNQWKIYDMTVEGVSLLRSYRSQFREILANDNFDTLLTRMKSKNNS